MKPTAYIYTFAENPTKQLCFPETIPIHYVKNDVICTDQSPLTVCEELYAIPDGYKLVPIEPTEEMLFAVDNEHNRYLTNSNKKKCYKYMIEAAPDLEDI